MSDKPLSGIKVLDFTRVLAGPYCTLMLADLGADVIKIEAPGYGDDSRHFGPPFIKGESIYFLSVNRGKQSIVINLKTEKGINIIKRLVKKVDILVENFRPGVMEKLGIGYNELKKINPRLIYASSSGFGHYGPDSRKPGYDLIIQAMGGVMSITSYKEDGPFTKMGVSGADIIAGMRTAFAVTTQLFRREITGVGDKIDVSMLDCQVAFLTPMIAAYLNKGIVARPVGNRHPLVAPFAVFRTKDDRIVITAGNDVLFQKLCNVLNLTHVKKDSRFRNNPSRLLNYKVLYRIIETKTRKYNTAQLLDLMHKAGIPASRINTVRDVVKEP